MVLQINLMNDYHGNGIDCCSRTKTICVLKDVQSFLTETLNWSSLTDIKGEKEHNCILPWC